MSKGINNVHYMNEEDMNFKLNGLIRYFEHIQQQYRLNITIKDYVNFIYALDKDIIVSLIPYLSHQNSFCNYIKSHDLLHEQCLNMAKIIKRKLQKSPNPFFGICHAGIGELIYPIIYDKNILIGFITIGPFSISDLKSRQRIRKLSLNNSINYNQAIKHFHDIDKVNINQVPSITGMFEIVADYFSMVHHQNILNGKYIEKKPYTLKEEITLNKILEYININYKEDLHLDKISAYCHCSKSYISHLFKKITGLSLSEYTLRLRIHEAKDLLVNSDETITNIAFMSGFNDSNYFSKAFKKLNNLTPTEFRAKHHNNKYKN